MERFCWISKRTLSGLCKPSMDGKSACRYVNFSAELLQWIIGQHGGTLAAIPTIEKTGFNVISMQWNMKSASERCFTRTLFL